MKIIKKHKYILIIFIVTVALLFKLFVTSRYYGHDTAFHVPNIIQLSKTISIDKIFGAKIVNFDVNKFGYGTWFFYPKLPHLLGAYIYLIVKNIYTSMNIIYFITTFLSGVFMFLLSKKIFDNKKVALISSVIYLSVPYHLSEIYVRDAYAENFMFMVIPLIFLGLYYLKDNEYNKFYLTFILGYLIGIHSHLISMVFCTIFVALFILYHYKTFFKKDKLKTLIISTIIVTGLSLPFLITVIEYKLTNTYTVFLSDTFAYRPKVAAEALNLKAYYSQVPRYDKIATYFNYPTIILFIITTIQIIFKKNKNREKLIPILLLIILLINLISSRVIWKNIPEFFITIQFPWRLLVFLSAFVALYAPVCLINDFKINKIIKNTILVIIILFFAKNGVDNILYYSNIELMEETTLNATLAMGYQKEYLPIQTNKATNLNTWNLSYAEGRKDGIFSSDINVMIKIIEDKFPNLTFKVENLSGDTTLELPRVYYLGYKLKDNKGNEIQLVNNKNGFLEAKINKNGEYTLTHQETKIEKIANFIGLLTFIVSIIFVVKRYKNER